MSMMNTEFHDWNAAHTYTEIEKINWLLNAIETLETKDKYSQRVRNSLYEIIKQQQAKMNEVSSTPAVVHPTVVHLQKEAEAYKDYIQNLNREITHLRTACADQQRRLQRIYKTVEGR